MKRITIFFAVLLLLLIPAAAQNEYEEEIEEIAAEDSISLPDSKLIQDMTEDSIAGDELFYEDSIAFELPEGMIQNLDSILDNWMAKNCLYSPDCETSEINPVYPDSVYAERMSRMQTLIDMPYNYIVRQFIDRYTGKNRQLVSYMLGAANYYMPIFEEALDHYDLPIELKYLPIIESALNPTAVSRARAKGLWQFIFSTGKLCGLKQNSLIDERFDPVKSSYAAARYLKSLYETFGDWNLAISAYNCGPGNINKAIRRSGGKTDFWEIYRYLPRETRSYLPIFIAANYIMTYYKEHNICPMQACLSLSTDTLIVTRNLHFDQITAACGIGSEEIEALNPQYIKKIIPGNSQPCTLKLPNNAISSLINAGDSLYAREEIFFPKSKGAEIQREMSGKNSRGDGVRHRIRSGESLSTIARKYRVTVSQLKKWNGLRSNNIRAGRYLYVY